MKVGKVNLTWWRKRPSVHIADVPLRAEDLPWFRDERVGLSPFLRQGITFHEPDPERIAAQEPLPVWGGNLLKLANAERQEIKKKIRPGSADLI